MATPKIPVVQNPKLFDRVLNIFNARLVVQLPWLSYAFGQAERMTREKGRVYPSVYAGLNIEGEYTSVLPDEFFGSDTEVIGFSFCDVSSIKYDTANTKTHGIVSADLGIVFWYNLKKVLNSNSEYRNHEKVVDACLKAVKASSKGFKGHILPYSWTKKAEEIYRGYSIKEIDQQFLIHPYGGVRINCEIRFFEDE